MNRDYKDGYNAGLNSWHFNMAKVNNKDYLEGWNDGWKKRYYWDKDK